MKKVGKMWILNDDRFFQNYFSRTQDQFELDNLQLALKYVTNTKVAIDGGAHYGSWTRYMAKHFDTVYAFEPHPKIYECLEKNTELFNNITLVESAIGKKADKIYMCDGIDNSGCGYVKPPRQGRARADGPGDIPVVTIDSYDLDDVGFIKLDVEGYEYFALQGALETINRCKPIIHLEDKGHSEQYGIKEGDAVQLIKEMGAELLATYKRALSEDYIFGWKK